MEQGWPRHVAALIKFRAANRVPSIRPCNKKGRYKRCLWTQNKALEALLVRYLAAVTCSLALFALRIASRQFAHVTKKKGGQIQVLPVDTKQGTRCSFHALLTCCYFTRSPTLFTRKATALQNKMKSVGCLSSRCKGPHASRCQPPKICNYKVSSDPTTCRHFPKH